MRRTTRITKPTFKVKSKTLKDTSVRTKKKTSTARADDGWADCDEPKSSSTKQVHVPIDDSQDIEILLSRLNMHPPTTAPVFSPISAAKDPIS